MKNKVGLLLATLVLAAVVIVAVVIVIKVDNKYLNAQQEPAVEASVSGSNTEKDTENDPGPCESTAEAEFQEVETTEDHTEEATDADDSQSSTSATSGNKKKNNNTAGLNECPKQTDWDDDSAHQESDIYPCDERPDYDDGSEESTVPAEGTTPEVSQEASTAAAEEPATEATTEVATEATTEATTTAAATDSAPQVDSTPASSGNTDSSATTSKAVTQEPELPPAEESFGGSAAGKVSWEDPKIPVPDNGDSTEATTEATTTAATTEAAATEDDWIPTWNDGQTAEDMSTAQTSDPFNQQEDLPSDFGGGGDFEPVE